MIVAATLYPANYDNTQRTLTVSPKRNTGDRTTFTIRRDDNGWHEPGLRPRPVYFDSAEESARHSAKMVYRNTTGVELTVLD